ncbi:MAG: SRPBCC domain-containing protein [Cucumibacter sp.]
MTDVDELAGAAERAVTERLKDGKRLKVVRIARTYPTSVADAWDALTNRERIPRWFLPIAGDLKVGGKYQLTGNAGGTITDCTPPKFFAATWEYGPAITWIEVSIAKDGNGARVTLEHLAEEEEHWKKYGPGAVGIGWDLGFLGLGKHLTTGGSLNAEEENAWVMTPEGRRFVELASDAWTAADIGSGRPEADARKAGARTTAFYTGQPEPE